MCNRDRANFSTIWYLVSGSCRDRLTDICGAVVIGRVVGEGVVGPTLVDASFEVVDGSTVGGVVSGTLLG